MELVINTYKLVTLKKIIKIGFFQHVDFYKHDLIITINEHA